jgi:MFS family permease
LKRRRSAEPSSGRPSRFLGGIALFTLASLACGSATTQGTLIAARVVQGFGCAVVSAVSLSLMVALFVEPHDRAKAMGVFGFVASGGGSLGVLLGGILTDVLDWHWIFLVNVPIGIGVAILAMRVLPAGSRAVDAPRLDVAGAITVTAALMLAVYAIVNGNQAGWTSAQTLGFLAGAAVLLAGFVALESRVRSPLVPLGLFRRRNLATANGVGVLWAGAMFAWFFLSALYLQLILGYSPLQVGLAFLPANLIMGAFSLGVSRSRDIAASRTSHLLSFGQSHIGALNAGYHTAFLIGAGFALLAASLGALPLREKATTPAADHASAVRSDNRLADATL